MKNIEIIKKEELTTLEQNLNIAKNDILKANMPFEIQNSVIVLAKAKTLLKKVFEVAKKETIAQINGQYKAIEKPILELEKQVNDFMLANYNEEKEDYNKVDENGEVETKTKIVKNIEKGFFIHTKAGADKFVLDRPVFNKQMTVLLKDEKFEKQLEKLFNKFGQKFIVKNNKKIEKWAIQTEKIMAYKTDIDYKDLLAAKKEDTPND